MSGRPGRAAGGPAREGVDPDASEADLPILAPTGPDGPVDTGAARAPVGRAATHESVDPDVGLDDLGPDAEPEARSDPEAAPEPASRWERESELELDHGREPDPAGTGATEPRAAARPSIVALAAAGSAVAALVLAGTSTGSALVAAVALALSVRSLRGGVAVVAAVLAAATRVTNVGFDALAGAQSVLGPAVRVGPPAGAAASGLAAAALVLAVRRAPPATFDHPPAVDRLLRLAPCAAAGVLAGAVAAGPGAWPDVAIRVAASLLGIGLAIVVSGPRGEGRRGLRLNLAAFAGLAALGASVASVTARTEDVWVWRGLDLTDDLPLSLAAAVAVTAVVIAFGLAVAARSSQVDPPPKSQRAGVGLRRRRAAISGSVGHGAAGEDDADHGAVDGEEGRVAGSSVGGDAVDDARPKVLARPRGSRATTVAASITGSVMRRRSDTAPPTDGTDES